MQRMPDLVASPCVHVTFWIADIVRNAINVVQSLDDVSRPSEVAHAQTGKLLATCSLPSLGQSFVCDPMPVVAVGWCADGLTCCHTCVLFVVPYGFCNWLCIAMLVCEVKTSCLAILVYFSVSWWSLPRGWRNIPIPETEPSPNCIGDFHGDCFMIDLTKEVYFGEQLFGAWWPQNPRDTPRNETESPLKPAQIQVTLPSGYLCTVVGNGTADPLGEKAFFKHLGKNWREIIAGTTISYRLN